MLADESILVYFLSTEYQLDPEALAGLADPGGEALLGSRLGPRFGILALLLRLRLLSLCLRLLCKIDPPSV